MQDPRLEKLADVLIRHSTKIQAGETVLIQGYDMPEDMIIALIRKVREVGGIPLISIKNNRIQRELIHAGDIATMQQAGDYEAYRMKRVQAYIGLRGSRNISELSDVSSTAMDIYEKHWLKPCTLPSAYRTPNGWSCDGPRLLWHNRRNKVLKHLKIFILTSARSTMAKWPKRSPP